MSASSLARRLADSALRPKRPVPAVLPLAKIIDEYRLFPQFSEISSGPNGAGGMQVPEHLQNFVACLRRASGDAFLVCVIERQAEVSRYMAAMRSELSAQNIRFSTEPVFVTQSVLAEVRKAAEVRKSSTTLGSSTKSESVEVFRSWVATANKLRATDLHLSVDEAGRGRVQVRLDGELVILPGTEQGLSDAQVLNAIKSAYESLSDRHSNSDGTFSESKSMSCMISASIGTPNLRLRFSSQRGFFGPKAVVRLLSTDVNKRSMSFEDMGFSAQHIALLEKAQRMEEGVVLQCGVTGSGKTTAAKTFLETHPKSGRVALYQIADPIEYVVRGVHQIGVQRDILTIAEAGKKDAYSEVVETLMRMDPDVIDLGEIRDVVSARAMANVAKTGHMAMGTLHTGSISGVFTRLTDPKLGLDRAELTTGAFPYLLCYQALCPVLCVHCALDFSATLNVLNKTGEAIEAAYLERIYRAFSRLPVDVSRLRFRNPEGCQRCIPNGRKGTSGLTIAAEMMIPDGQWFDLSAAGRDRDAWRSYRQTYSDKDLMSGNMTGKTAMEHAMFKAQLGLIDLRQVDRFGAIDDYEAIK